MKKKHTFLNVSLVISLLFLLVACKEEKAGPQGAMPPPFVTVMEVKATDHPYVMNFQAVTQGSRAVEVRARVQALIKERTYVEGEYVQAGQILFQLERDEYEARMNQSKAQYEQAEREWNRIRPLYAKNAVSQKERDNALAALASSEAALRLAQINLDYCQVKAPVSGYTGKEEVTAGNLVSNGTLMTSVNQTDPLFVNFSFPGTTFLRNQQLAEQGRLELPKNNAYTAKIRLIDGSMFPTAGKVTFVDSQVDQSTGVVKSRAEFPNAKDAVFPGQYVRIFIEGAILKKAILVPQRAVLNTAQGSIVMLVNEKNIVEARPIKVGINVDQMYLIDGGLNLGDRIITDGLVKARPGQPVSLEAPKRPGQPGQNAQAGKTPQSAKAPEAKPSEEKPATGKSPEGQQQ